MTRLFVAKYFVAAGKNDWSDKVEQKCEKNLAQLAHKKNVVGRKRVTNTVLVCHVAHKLAHLAHKERAVESMRSLADTAGFQKEF
jgi:hypothetical protein